MSSDLGYCLASETMDVMGGKPLLEGGLDGLTVRVLTRDIEGDWSSRASSYDARGTSRGQGGGRDAGASAVAGFRGGWVGGWAVPSTVLRRCSRHQTGWIWDTGNQRYRYLFLWDPLDRMTWHNGPGINRVLAYTADGERIVERDFTNGVTTISLRGLDAKVLREVKLQSGAYSWQKDYIYREGQILASHGHNEPLQHYHLDHLGTPRMLTNRCGERLQRFESFPFGEAIAELPQHPEKMRLTGHQRDLNQPSTTEDDLDYMHARYCGTKMGRFVSVDAGTARSETPQSWNRYSYVRGKTVSSFDPDGREPKAALLVTGPTPRQVLSDPSLTTLYELTTLHSAIRIYDNDATPPVDVVYSWGGQASCILPLDEYLAAHDPRANPTGSFELKLDSETVQRLQQSLESQRNTRTGDWANLNYHWATNNCAQKAQTEIMGATKLTFKQQLGAAIGRALVPVTINTNQLVARLFFLDLLGKFRWMRQTDETQTGK